MRDVQDYHSHILCTRVHKLALACLSSIKHNSRSANSLEKQSVLNQSFILTFINICFVPTRFIIFATQDTKLKRNCIQMQNIFRYFKSGENEPSQKYILLKFWWLKVQPSFKFLYKLSQSQQLLEPGGWVWWKCTILTVIDFLSVSIDTKSKFFMLGWEFIAWC